MQRIPRQLLAGVIVLTAGGVAGVYGAAQLPRPEPVAAVAAPAPAQAPSPSPTPAAPPPPPPPAAPAKPVLRLDASSTPKHGALVVDGVGLTLYRSDQDSAAPPASRCVGGCLDNWKPVFADDADIATGGVEATRVGTITRADGRQQVTLAGWPLYRFVGDTKPGDVTGQCKAGFFAVSPTGGKSM
jgi:predicted lipoprotein with Yx(FWY)xxD motif